MHARKRIGKSFGVLAVATAGVLAVPAAAQAAGPWSTSYETATASGSAERTSSSLTTRVTVTGQVTGTDASRCYRVQIVVHEDFTQRVVPLADHCGTSSTSFSGTASGMRVITNFSVRLCRVVNGAVTSCGSGVRV